MLARLGETWVITRRDYERSIEAALPSLPERQDLRFIYVELPERLRSWQRDLRGLRVYYLLWQIAALGEARRLERSIRFDVVWHLTWATAWYGTLASLAGRPFVYGPVGGCVGPLWRLLPRLGWSGATFEIARALVTKGLGRYLNPLARLSWHRADLILAQNMETRNWFPSSQRAKARPFPNAVITPELTEDVVPKERSGPPTAVFAGRLEPWKGAFLSLETMALLPDWRLVICGTGKDERRLRRLAGRLAVEGRVEWAGWLPREDVLRRMADADVFLYPCLREDSGLVMAEARAAGLPIVCLDRGGPSLLAGPTGICVSPSGGVDAIARRLADAAVTALEHRRSGAERGSDDALLLPNRARALGEILSDTLHLPIQSAAARHTA